MQQVIFALLFLMAISLLIVYKYKRTSFICCTLTVVLILAHTVLDHLGLFNGFLYYFTAAMTDLVIIKLISLLPITRTNYRLQVIALVSIVANFIGWLLWFFYLPPMLYNLVFMIIYLATLVVMLFKSADGNCKINYRRVTIRGSNNPRVQSHPQEQVQAQT